MINTNPPLNLYNMHSFMSIHEKATGGGLIELIVTVCGRQAVNVMALRHLKSLRDEPKCFVCVTMSAEPAQQVLSSAVNGSS